jgi:hypothetical protein
MVLQEQIHNTEWAIGNDREQGTIPPEYRLVTLPDILPLAPSYDLKIKETALRTQNHDKGIDRFLRYYDEDKLRRLLLDTMYRHTTTEVFWTAMAKWANF